jgi:hypothetical protein
MYAGTGERFWKEKPCVLKNNWRGITWKKYHGKDMNKEPYNNTRR